MVELRDNLNLLEDANVQLAAVSYDAVDVLEKFSDAKDIPFPLLSDEGSKTIKAFDLESENGLPHPGTLLIDQQGIIRAKLFREGYRTRHTIDELVGAAKELQN